MAKRHHEDWLKAFVQYASFGEAPLSMYFWTGVAAVAGALRRKVWIDQGYFQWIPNFYIILVAPPGIVSKSTTSSIGMNLLREVPGIKFGPDVVTWQKLAQSLAESTELFSLSGEIGPGHFDLNADLHPMSAITLESSEFGTFLNPNDREMVDVLVSLWDGKRGTFVKQTKTQGEDKIENPYVNIIACTTPAWLEGNFPEYMIGGGFTSRCIFIFADQKRQLVAYPGDVVPAEFLEMKQKLIEDLVVISKMAGNYTISNEAKEWGIAWYQDHYTNRPPHLNNERFGGYIARKQTHMHKLAMVLAASQSSELVIQKEHLVNANLIITALEKDMPRVFERIGTAQNAMGGAHVVRVVENFPGISPNELYRHLFRQMSYDDFQKALQSAVAAQHVKQLNTSTGLRVYPYGQTAVTNQGGTGSSGNAAAPVQPNPQPAGTQGSSGADGPVPQDPGVAK